MRIALLVDPLDTQSAGVHFYVKGLVSALEDLDDGAHEWILVRPDQKPSTFTILEVPIHSAIPFHQRIRQFWDIPKTLEKWKPDVVVEFAHFGPFNLPTSVKRVTFIHDLTPLLFPSFHPRYSSLLHRWFLKFILAKADLILTNSRHTQSDVQQYLGTHSPPIEVVYPGINTIDHPITYSEIEGKYNLERPYFVHVGTIEPRKNITTILQAFEQFCHRYSEGQFVLAGGAGWRAEAIEQQIQQFPFPNRLKRLGYVPTVDLPALYTQAQALIFPSIYEGFGLPIIDAMHYGCPVIASNTSSLPEAGGEAALYFSPKDSSRLLDHMIQVTSPEVRSDLIQKGKQQITQFSWEQSAKTFLAYLENL